jgi:diketogulonate reductase-like aldo/keto reductase
MPLLGLGVWQVPDGEQTENAVSWALEAGYRHVDTAQVYGNESAVGRAIHSSGLHREEVFVTTKLNPQTKDAGRAIQESLGRLRLVDLFLIHWPSAGAVEQWGALASAASCTAAEPAPPAAAWISTASPWRSSARSNSPSHARWNGK